MTKRKINTLTICLCILLWIVCSIPYIVSGYANNIIDALFESCSGLTTTGASVFYANLEELPSWLLIYRSFTNWLGALLVLLFIFRDNKKRVAYFYSFLSFSLFILLWVSGMEIEDSLCYAMSTISTGGFTTGININEYPISQIILIVFMLIAVFDYALLLKIRRKGLKVLAKDGEIRFFITTFILSACLIFILNCVYSHFSVNPTRTLLDSAFNVASILSTTGYASVDFMMWPPVSIMILMALYFINGCTNSPSGGIKCYRIIVCLKLIKRSFTLRIHPNRIVPLSYNGSELSTESAIAATSYILTYLATFAFSTVLLSLSNLDFITCLTSAASLLSNIGSAVPANGIMLIYSNLPGLLKLICPIIMFMGRLELTMVMMLFSRFYWNTNRG